MLNRNSQTPLYVQLADLLREQILSGQIRVGDKLPSETEMVRAYGLGRLTVRDALAILANEGLIEKQHGRGTFCKASFSPPKYRIDVFLDLTDLYFVPHYLQAICGALETEDVSVVLNDTKNDTTVISALLDKVLSEGTNGVLFQPSYEAGQAPVCLQEALQRLREQNVPYIMLDSVYHGVPSSYAVMNEKQSGVIAANYFRSLGHENLCMIVREGFADSKLRQQGFCSVLNRQPYIISYSDDLVSEIQRMHRERPDITGIFCYNDSVARACYRALKKLSLQVPADVSVIGVDDTVIASTLSPSLTSVVHSKGYLGKVAAEALLSMIMGQTSWPLEKVFEPSLTIRKSCRSV